MMMMLIKMMKYKIGKQSGTTYCFECNDYTKNFRSQEDIQFPY